MTNIDLLKEQAQILLALLNDPQTGLFTWHDAVYTAIDEIARFATKRIIDENLSNFSQRLVGG